jgi:hypothetical protein
MSFRARMALILLIGLLLWGAAWVPTIVQRIAVHREATAWRDAVATDVEPWVGPEGLIESARAHHAITDFRRSIFISSAGGGSCRVRSPIRFGTAFTDPVRIVLEARFTYSDLYHLDTEVYWLHPVAGAGRAWARDWSHLAPIVAVALVVLLTLRRQLRSDTSIQRPGRRQIGMLVCSLLIGAIANIAVAWGCAWLFFRSVNLASVGEPTLGFDFEHADRAWHAVVQRHFGSRLARAGSDRDEVADLERLRPPPWWVRRVHRWMEDVGTVEHYEFGWPMRSMQYVAVYDGTWLFHDHRIIAGGWRPRASERAANYQAAALPLIPIWPGFAINTLLYGAALWLLLAGPGALRRIMRRRRGRCPKCNYDLRGVSGVGCPECGRGRKPEAAAS